MTIQVQSDLLAQAVVIAREHWNIEDEPTRLAGDNLNVRFDAGVLKITLEPQADPELEDAVASMLAEAGIPVPRTLPARDGEGLVPIQLGGRSGIARLQTLLPGTPWQVVEDPNAALLAIGAMLARLHLAIEGFEHERADRTHPWDLAHAGQYRDAVALTEDGELRAALEHALHLHAACDLSSCPRGMLHGDFNTENILLEGDSVSGVLDLGDCLRGALVADLAIAVAYALHLEPTDLEDAAALVGAYDAIRPLAACEQQAIVPLALGRMATGACVAAQRAMADPDSVTWFSPLQSTREAMLALAQIPPREAEAVLCRRCVAPRAPAADSTLRAARGAHLPGVLSLSYDQPLHIVRGRGQFLFDANDRPYLDLVNNVCHVGHCHEHVVAALATQATQLNTNTRYLHENVIEYARRLADTMPDPLDTCIFVNSGSEANELALRIAQAATSANDVIVLEGAYHGSSGACVAMSPYKFNGPGGQGCPPWVHVAPAPDIYRGEFKEADAGEQYARGIGSAIDEAPSIAAFFAESLLSCGGQVPLPGGYLAAAYERVRTAGGLCIADEVQVGFGRVGEFMWGFELQGVVPDIVVLGKPIGNGHPIGAVVTTKAIAELFDSGMEFFSTFGGNPVSAAVGLAVLEVIEREGLQERARVLGERFLAGLRDLQDRQSLIGDVRGRGLFLGIELVRDVATLEPADGEASAAVNAMCDRGVLLSTDGPLRNVIKIKPPMVLSERDVDMTLRLLDDVLSGVC